MAFRSTPQLGPGLEDVIPVGEVWFDIPGAGTLISPMLGNPEWGTDGRKYILVQASAEISATPTTGTEVDVTEGTWQAATGSSPGGWFTPPATLVPQGAYFWARKETL